MRLDVSSKSSAKIHLKHQALFSSKVKILKCRLMQFLFGALRLNLNSPLQNNGELNRIYYFLFFVVYLAEKLGEVEYFRLNFDIY